MSRAQGDDIPDTQVGQRPLPSDLLWKELAEALTPDRMIDRLMAGSSAILTFVSTVGVLLGVASALATSAVGGSSAVVVIGGLLTTLFCATAVLLALWSLVVRTSSVAIGNLREVHMWFLQEVRRGRAAALSGRVLLAGCATAFITTLIVGIGVLREINVQDSSLDGASLTASNSQDGRVVTLRAIVRGLDYKDLVEARITAYRGGAQLVSSVALPDSEGNVVIDVTASVDIEMRIEGSILVTRNEATVKSYDFPVLPIK